MEIKSTKIQGRIHSIEIIGHDAVAELVVAQSDRDWRRTNTGYATHGDKSDIRDIENLARQLAAQAAPRPTKSTGSRRIELLATALDQGLNHGKSWICSAYDVDAKGVHPAYEGQAICYVYA